MRVVISVFLVGGILLSGIEGRAATTGELKGSLTISGAWAIYPTAVAWAEAFQKRHPGVKIDVCAGGAGKGAADTIAGLVDIGMVSRDPDPAELQKGIEAVYILKDAVFPVVSEKNFYARELREHGIKRRTLVDLYITGAVTQWSRITGAKADKPVHVYTRADSAGAAASWAAYLGKKQEDLRGVGVYGDPGLLEAVKRDPLGIGYSNFGYVFTREGPALKGIRPVPVDVNENGRADSDEVYENRAQAVAAIASGRYPATRRNYFFIRQDAPALVFDKRQGALVKEFIRFALSEEGAKIVEEVGASLPLLPQERDKVLGELGTP